MADRVPGVEYTPEELALDFCRHAAVWCPNPTTIYDPACGEGALLRAAREVWPDAWLVGSDIDAKAVEKASEVADVCEVRNYLFDDEPPLEEEVDLLLMNPPWIGQVSRDLGASYAKKIKTKFGREAWPYNGKADICAAFILQAAMLRSKQISVLATNTAWQGLTGRSGHDPVTFEYCYTPCTFGGWTHPLKAQPPTHKWPGEAAVHYSEVHYVHMLKPVGTYVSPGHKDRVHPACK